MQEGIADIDFGVANDLCGMSSDEIAATLKELGQSSQVISEFNRLIHGTAAGSFLVTSTPKSVTGNERKWSVGKVVSGYKFRPNIPNDRHTIQVKWASRRYTDNEITELIGVDPSGRRLAINPLDALFTPEPALAEEMN